MSIKQSHKESATFRDSTSDSIPACWQRERNRECLLVKTHPGEVFLLPYQQFVGAHLKEGAGKEILIIAFSSHRLTIEGHHLDEIVSALQEFSVEWISPTPTRYLSLRDEFSPIVAKIQIDEVE